MLTKNAIEKFAMLYEKKFGEELSDDEALFKGAKLLNLYRTIYGSLSLEQIKKMRNANENNNQQS